MLFNDIDNFIEVIVAIGRYCLFVWATVVGIGVLCLWFTIGGSRSPSNRASLWEFRARQVAGPAVTRGVRQYPWCSQGEQTYCDFEILCGYVNRPANTRKSI